MIRGVLFDLDGTLLDSAPDLVGALNHVREGEGLDALDVAPLRPHVSRGARGLIDEGLPPASEAVQDARVARFLEYYRRHHYEASTLFPEVIRLLDGLAQRGIPWGVVTNKIERFTHPILEAAGLAGRVGCVVCGDTIRWKKPHPEPVRLACELLGVAPAATVFVGDDPRDIESGQSAGALTAVAGYGYVDPETEAHTWKGAPWLESPLSLLEWIDARSAGAGEFGLGG
jgi:phosphoglycolate phosphatase